MSIYTKRKTHKSIRELSHAWAYANQGEGGTAAHGSYHYTGGELFSYRELIAKKIKSKKGAEACLFNEAKYSKTTTKHQSLARMAFSGVAIVGLWCGHGCRSDGFGNPFTTQNIIQSHLSKLESESQNLAKAKKESTRGGYKLEIVSISNNLKRLIDYDLIKKAELPLQLKKLLKIEINPAGLEILEKAAAKDLKKKLKAKKAKILAEIQDFRTFKKSWLSQDAKSFNKNGDLIRYNLKENTIETSQGITVPILEALLLYKVSKSHHEKKFAANYSNKMMLDGKFKVDQIDEKGNAKVGCHFFNFAEIERCYKEEYLKLKGSD
jgi:hypothetical protein